MKHPVRIRYFLNGEFKREEVSYRAVYEKKDGTYEINWMAGRREIQKKDGEFTVDFHARSIKVHRAEEIFGGGSGS